MLESGLLFMGPVGTHFGEIWIEMIYIFYKKIDFKISTAKWLLLYSKYSQVKFHVA